MIFQGVVEEKGIISEIPFEEAAGFGDEAVEPFEADFLEGGWGLFGFAGVEGEGGADAEVDGWGEAVFVFCDPMFLFRAAEADPYEVRAGGADFFDDGFGFGFRPIAEGWGVTASDGCVGEFAGKAGGEFFQGAGFSAEEEMAMGGVGLVGGRDGFEHQVGSVNPIC